MIQNLNQVGFQVFGTVLPERVQSQKANRQMETQLVQLVCGDGPVFLAESDVYLSCSAGSSVLSVSMDAGNC